MATEHCSLVEVRDGLNTHERAVLFCLAQIQRELGRTSVPTAMLCGRVIELVDVSQDEVQCILQRMITRR